MRKRFDPAELRQRLLDAGHTGIAAYVDSLLREQKRIGILTDAGSSSVVGDELRKGLAVILEQMDAQFSIKTSYFYMGRTEVRHAQHPELITRPGITVLEWLSLASKLENVPPEAMKQLDIFCAEMARIHEEMNRPSVRLGLAVRKVYISLRRKLGMDVPDRIAIGGAWF